MNKVMNYFTGTSERAATSALWLIRFLVGWVFIFAGIRKFTEPAEMGAGRFADMGMPFPEFMGVWVGFWEIAGGLMVLLGLLTRAGAIPLIIVMIVAILTTKVPTFQADGWIAGLHSARLDVSLLLASTYLLIAGGGRYALDRLLRKANPDSVRNS